ncbi:MAG TPA: hypothetical protein VGD67_02310 [Pseudonocardiaceae bacterium]
MSVQEIALPHAGRAGQATQIEQSRAIAEVYAAAEMARRFPRNVEAARAAMLEACKHKELADRAFFDMPRAGGRVHGASVHLARELARCWGNLSWGVAELSRDDAGGQSEMLAYAWDLETNARASMIFIVPHARDKGGRVEKLPDLQAIYENNANAGARRLRECVFAVLPQWFIEQAKASCVATLEAGNGESVAKRAADAIAGFARLQVTEEDLVARIGRPAAQWTDRDLGQLRVAFTSLRNGETTREEAFPRQAAAVTTTEITAQATAAQATTPTPPAPAAEPGVLRKQVDEILAFARDHQLDEAFVATTLRVLSGRPGDETVTHPGDLTRAEADAVLGELRALAEQHQGNELVMALDALVAARAEQTQDGAR